MTSTDPFDTDFDQFTEPQLDSWFVDRLDGTEDFRAALGSLRHPDGSSAEFAKLDPGLREGLLELVKVENVWSSAPLIEPRNRDIDWAREFSLLSREFKVKFLNGWVRQFPPKPVAPEGPAEADPEWQVPDPTEVLITLPDGTQMINTADSDPDYEPTDYKLPADPKPGRGFDFSRWKLLIGVGGIVGLVLAVGLFLTAGGDGSDTGDTPEVSSNESSAPQTSTPPSPAAGIGACDAVREQQLILELTSPDAQPTIPLAHALGQGEFLSPALDWSPVPAETTEIAVLVQLLANERAALYTEDPLLWWGGGSLESGSGGVPIGKRQWLVTGIGPSAAGLARSSRIIPLPEGVVENPHPSTVQLDGVIYDSLYFGPALPGDHFLFTVFALCDPEFEGNYELDSGSLQHFSIATGWFISEFVN